MQRALVHMQRPQEHTQQAEANGRFNAYALKPAWLDLNSGFSRLCLPDES